MTFPTGVKWGTMLAACVLAASPYAALAQTSASAGITAQGATPQLRFAPGDTVPLAVKLTNFGSNARTDVTVYYQVSDPAGASIFETSETVAVETTANYIKDVPLPAHAAPGIYTVKTQVTYDGQDAPAVSSYQFTVERMYFGVYQSDLIWYVLGFGVLLLILILLFLLLLRHRREARLAPHDYSAIASDTRIYYELISDAVQQMRYHEGDRAIELAQSIPGLVIDAKDGRVVHLASDPSIIMATLIAEYRARFNRNVNLSLGSQAASRAIVR